MDWTSSTIWLPRTAGIVFGFIYAVGRRRMMDWTSSTIWLPRTAGIVFGFIYVVQKSTQDDGLDLLDDVAPQDRGHLQIRVALVLGRRVVDL